MEQEKPKFKFHPASLVELKKVMQELGASPNQDKDRSKWKYPEKGNIFIKGQMWNDVNNEIGGRGATSLVAHLLDISKKEAIDWLLTHFKEDIDMDKLQPIGEEEETVKKSFKPPDPVPQNLEEIKNYLVHRRGLPENIITDLIKQEKIYADNKKRCIFMGPESAEIRATLDEDGFKGCAAGSDTESSGFSVFAKGIKPKGIAIQEAAIDAISYFAMHQDLFCFSSNGSGRFKLHLKIIEEAINRENKIPVIMATDADFQGDKAAQKQFNAQYLKHYLSRKLNVPQEQILDWLTKADKKNKISIVFRKVDEKTDGHDGTANEDESDLDVTTVVSGADAVALNDKKELFFSKDSFEQGSSYIRFKVTPGLHPAFTDDKKIYKVDVTESAYNFIRGYLTRDRPVLTKDWNEEYKKTVKNRLAP